MSFFQNLFSSSHGTREAGQGPETAPVKMNLDERMAFRREMLFDSVKTTMQSHGILSGSYRFKVVRADKRGHSFVVMVDLSTDFMDSEQGRPRPLLALGLAMQIENVLSRFCSRLFFEFFGLVDAPADALQELPRILKVTAPQKGRTFAGQPEGGICAEGVVCDLQAFGGRRATLRAPARRTGRASFGPVNQRAHANTPRARRRKKCIESARSVNNRPLSAPDQRGGQWLSLPSGPLRGARSDE